MKIVFFDMEFANGKIPGSVYSLGYVKTNDRFELVEPQTDLLINPDCEWNAYVRSHILAYSMSTVEQASLFPAYYKRLKKLLCGADLVVGFAVKNDTLALEKACQRYRLKPLSFQCLDMERLCKSLKDYPQAHGLAGYVRAYCGIEPDNRHRSDGDAYATMLLLREVCRRREVPLKKVKKEFSEYLLSSVNPTPKKEKRKKGISEEEIAVLREQAYSNEPARKRRKKSGGGVKKEAEQAERLSGTKPHAEQRGHTEALPISPLATAPIAKKRRRRNGTRERMSLPKQSDLGRSTPASGSDRKKK